MKVVINNCFGGFGLSHEGVMDYARRKGITLWPEEGRFGLVTYWKVPPEERPEPQDDFYKWPIEKCKASNKAHEEAKLYDRDIPRDDPDLVATVESLGPVADGRCACLKVVEIPDGVDWEIEEYDGNEWVSEVHRVWS